MNAHTTLIHAYDSLARHCHRWPAKARALAMADLWRCAQLIKQEENMPGTPWKYDTLEKLREAGYSYEERGACADPTCKTVVFWFITPNKKWMPFEQFEKLPAGPSDAPVETRYQPHFVSCPGARRFSRKSKDTIEERTA